MVPASTGRYCCPAGRIDTRLGKETVHAEGAGLVRHDGHDVAAEILVAQQLGQHAHHHHGGGDLPIRAFCAGQQVREHRKIRRGQAFTGHSTLRQKATQCLPARKGIADFFRVLRRLIKAGCQHVLFG